MQELVRELDGAVVDYFHIDCNDDVSVFEDIKEIRKQSKTPVDVHIISSEPEKFYPLIMETAADLVTFQYENLKRKPEIPKEIKSKLGLAIVSETDINVFSQYRDRFDFVLFMTTTPGKSGGTFNKENFKKIRDFQKLFPEKKIIVDGGVNADISFVLRNMGVYAVVSGNYLVNADGIGNALHNMRSNYYVPSGMHVSDVMLTREEVPVLNEHGTSFADVLNVIEKYNFGFTAVTEGNGKLSGLISNADVRKGLIRKINDLNSIEVKDLINRKPISVYDDYTVTEMIEFIKNTRQNILYLLVVDRKNNLTGAMIFTNLIKGE